MQKVFILKKEVNFELIAALLMETSLVLTDVVSCTFPSRPEPKSAQWESDKIRMINYVYLPDIEVRYLSLVNREFLEGQSFDGFWAELSKIVLFESWADFAITARGDYRTNLRAIHAFRVGAELGDTSHPHLISLMNSLDVLIENGDEGSAEIVAEVLREIAVPEFESKLRELYEASTSLILKSHLRKAIDRCMNSLEF